MKRKVIKIFREKSTGEIFRPNSSYESTDSKRIEFLEQEGYLKSEEKSTALKKEPVKVESKPTTKKKTDTRKKSGE